MSVGNMPDFNRRYAISGGIVQLFYSALYTLFCKDLSTLFKKSLAEISIRFYIFLMA